MIIILYKAAIQFVMASIDDILEKDKEELEVKGIYDFLKKCYSKFYSTYVAIINKNKDLTSTRVMSMIENTVTKTENIPFFTKTENIPFYIGYCLHVLGVGKGDDGKNGKELLNAMRRYTHLISLEQHLEKIWQKLYEKKEYQNSKSAILAISYLKERVKSEHDSISPVLSEQIEDDAELIELTQIVETHAATDPKEISKAESYTPKSLDDIKTVYENLKASGLISEEKINIFFEEAIKNPKERLELQDPNNPAKTYRMRPIDFAIAHALAEIEHRNGVDTIKKYQNMLSLRKKLSKIIGALEDKAELKKERATLEMLNVKAEDYIVHLIKNMNDYEYNLVMGNVVRGISKVNEW